MGIKVSRTYLEKKLSLHPDYPSLACISDTLDSMHINNGAYVMDKEKWDLLPFPFLAHSKKNGGKFIVVTNQNKELHNKFFEDWDGIALFAEQPENWRHEENELALFNEKKRKWQSLSLTAVLILLACLSLAPLPSLLPISSFIVAAAGLFVSVLIVQKELGFTSNITEKLCDAGRADCDNVINSKGRKITKNFNWADAGIIYFSSLTPLLLIPSLHSCAALIAISAMPFTIFSVYYQWRVVKSWCMLCLITVGILWLQAALSIPSLLSLTAQTWSISAISLTIFIFTLSAVAWLKILKPLLNQHTQLEQENFTLQRFKYNIEVFQAVLKRQRQIDTTPFEEDLQIGNKNAAQQIIVACNPYCGPCATAHEFFHDLVEAKNIGVTIRFTVDTNKKNDKKYLAVAYLLQLLKNRSSSYKREVLHDWFKIMDLEKFSKMYPMGEQRPDALTELESHRSWVERSDIAFTPTIFLNKHELPKEYKRTDLLQLIQSEESVTEEAFSSN